jgi:hypothetical protein
MCNEHSNLFLTESASKSWLIVLAKHVVPPIQVEVFQAPFATVSARLFTLGDINTCCLATLYGDRKLSIITTTGALVESLELWGGTLWADETIEKFFAEGFINTNALAVIPLFASSLAENHHAMIIRSTTDAVLTTIVAFGVRVSSRCLAFDIGDRRLDGVCFRTISMLVMKSKKSLDIRSGLNLLLGVFLTADAVPFFFVAGCLTTAGAGVGIPTQVLVAADGAGVLRFEEVPTEEAAAALRRPSPPLIFSEILRKSPR